MMQLFIKNGLTWQLQAIIWLIIFILSFIANLQYDSFSESLSDATMLVVFYPVIIYVNAYVLLPRFYSQGKVTAYCLSVLVLLIMTIVLRVITVNFLYNTFFTTQRKHLTIHLFIYTSFSFCVIYLFSIIFRLAIDYFTLNERHAAIKVEQVQTELAMLKHQVQPHFLFNTLNNIYYVVQKDSPESAGLIVRLSGIIRYFMDESQKERVFLKDEIALLQSYIELENIRMRFNFFIDFQLEGNMDEILIPPLLLLPITENIYKHGLDKRRPGNTAHIRLSVTDRQLSFSTYNKRYNTQQERSGSSIKNLKKRLSLYYGDKYELNLTPTGDSFHVNLIIPLLYDPLYIN